MCRYRVNAVSENEDDIKNTISGIMADDLTFPSIYAVFYISDFKVLQKFEPNAVNAVQSTPVIVILRLLSPYCCFPILAVVKPL